MITMSKRIIICRSNPVAPDPRVEKIARTLFDNGYNVSIVCWDRSAQLKKKDSYLKIPIHRIHIQALYGNGLANLPALLRWQWGLCKWLLQNHKSFDIIHACDFDTILPALICKLLWKKIVIYDIFDFYADHLRRTPDVIKKTIRYVDYKAIHHADGVIIVDDSRRKQIEGSRPKECISVYNSPEDVSQSITKITGDEKEDKKFRIAYVGLLQVERGIFIVLNILRRHLDWTLDLAGFGGDEKEIVEEIKDMPNVNWFGRVNYDQALAISDRAHVLFATYDPMIPNHRYSSPNKVFEGMMLGKPIIVAKNTNMDRMIEEASCGIVVQYGDEVELENAFSSLAMNHDEQERLGRNAREAYEKFYSWNKMEARLIEFYQRIIRKNENSDE